MDPRLLVLILLTAWSCAVRPARAQESQPTTVTCAASPCQVSFTATLDASQAVTQLAAANAASIEDPSSVGVTTEAMVRVFGGAFGLVLFFWSLGYGVGLVIGLIRKV